MSDQPKHYRTITGVVSRTFARVLLLSGACLTWPLLAAAESSPPAPLQPTATHQTTPTPSTSPTKPDEGIVNINTASAEELERLPGVGPTRARAILDLRARKPFKHLEDLMQVKGIGRATFRKLRPYLTLKGPTTRPDH